MKKEAPAQHSMPTITIDIESEPLNSEELNQLKPIVFPETKIKQELSRPGFTQRGIESILSAKLSDLPNIGDFSMNQLKEAQSYWVKDMTAEIREVGGAAIGVTSKNTP